MKQSCKHIPRFFVDEALNAGTEIQLTGERTHHLRNVLRAKTGDPVVIFNGRGGEYPGTVNRVDKSTVGVQLAYHRDGVAESPLKLVLAQGVARGDRMDHAIAKAVELGVYAIQPILSERSKVRLQGERAAKKLTHWQRIALSAAEQCGQTRVPEVKSVLKLQAFLQTPTAGRRLLLAPGAEQGLADCAKADSATLLIGPESGFTEHEVNAARQSGYQVIRFGPRVLRTETAGPACLAALQTLWGDLR